MGFYFDVEAVFLCVPTFTDAFKYDDIIKQIQERIQERRINRNIAIFRCISIIYNLANVIYILANNRFQAPVIMIKKSLVIGY